MDNVKWLKDCEICNTGLITVMDDLLEKTPKLTVNKAAKLVADEGNEKVGMNLYSAEAIRNRYRLHKGLRDPHPEKVGHGDPCRLGRAVPYLSISQPNDPLLKIA